MDANSYSFRSVWHVSAAPAEAYRALEELADYSSRVRADEAAGVLEARLTGDLTGSSRWLITDTGAGTRLVFEEDVVANKALLRRLGVVARPAFRANHRPMMRSGQRGLAAYVAGYQRGRSS